MTPSSSFVFFFGCALFIILAAALGYCARIMVTRNRDADSINPLSLPILVALSFSQSQILGSSLRNMQAILVFVIFFIYGLITGISGFTMFRKVRDFLLSIAAGCMAILLIVERTKEGPLSILLLTSLVFILTTIYRFLKMRMLPDAASGMSFLGAVEVCDFLVSPYGLSFWSYTSGFALFISVTAAILLGFLAVINPRLVIGLGVLGIAAANLLWWLLIWFAQANGEALGYAIDWTGWLTLLGTLTGLIFTWGFWTGFGTHSRP